MRPRDIAYYLYFASCVAALVAVIIGNESLLLIAKPVIVPSICFYYLTRTAKPNVFVILALLANFIGDSIVLVRFDNALFMIIPYLIGYLLVLRLIIGDIIGGRPGLFKIIVALSVMIALVVMVFFVLDVNNAERSPYITPMTVYGMVLSLMVAAAVLSYLLNKSVFAFYMMVFCVCSLISDVFYAIYNLHFHIPTLNYINTAMQLFSYFFLVKYSIARKMPIILNHKNDTDAA